MGPAADSAAIPRESPPAANIRFRSWAGLLRPAHIHARAIGLLVIRCRSAVPLSSPRKSAIEIEKKDRCDEFTLSVWSAAVLPPLSQRQHRQPSHGSVGIRP